MDRPFRQSVSLQAPQMMVRGSSSKPLSIYPMVDSVKVSYYTGPSPVNLAQIAIPPALPRLTFDHEEKLIADMSQRKIAAQRAVQRNTEQKKNLQIVLEDSDSQRRKLEAEEKQKAEEKRVQEAAQLARQKERAQEFEEMKRLQQEQNEKKQLAHLNPAQQNAVTNLKQITSISHEQSVLLLTLVNWDVNRAVMIFYDSDRQISVALNKAQQETAAQKPTPAPQQAPQAELWLYLPHGALLQQKFSYDTTLWTVLQFVQNSAPHLVAVSLRNNDGYKFTERDLDKTLHQAGLIPNACLHVIQEREI